MYPLNSDPNETQRLNNQIDLLEGEWISSIFRGKSGNVLDVGCGTGNLFKKIPAGWKYTGIDTTDRFEKISDDQQFIKENILAFETDIKFDIIICRLVLWSIPERNQVLKKIKQFSKKSTILYCYEPDDSNLKFSHELKSLNDLVLNWQKNVIPKGCDPFIGSKLDKLLEINGWSVVASKTHVHTFNGQDEEFSKHLENLLRIFSQSFPLPDQLLVYEAKVSIQKKLGSFTEQYVEVVGELQ